MQHKNRLGWSVNCLFDALPWLKKYRLVSPPPIDIWFALLRVAIVIAALAYSYSDFVSGLVSEVRISAAHFIAWGALVSALLLLVELFVLKRKYPIKALHGIFHDASTISIALYLGGAVTAPMAILYVWSILGYGIRGGIRYLYGGAVLCFLGFLCVYLFSDYWHHHLPFSITIAVLLVLVPPYVGSLLRALRRAQAQIKWQAAHDPLTGLPNRRELDSCLEDLSTSEGEVGYTMLYCDLDGFKKVNDTGGHAVGDKMLQEISGILRKHIRQGDVISRLGGDEFCILLKECSIDQGRRIAEELRKSIGHFRLNWAGFEYHVNVSIGIVSSREGEMPGELLRLADTACYAAKRAGRNRVSVVQGKHVEA